MTKQNGMVLVALVVALGAALLFGGYFPALAQDGEDAPGDTLPPCPLWGDPENLPEDWSEDMPYGPGMMWYYYNGGELPDGTVPCPLWGDPENLPEGWPEDMPYGPGMMWQYHNDGEFLEGVAPCPMWDSSATWGRGMRPGRGFRGHGMMW